MITIRKPKTIEEFEALESELNFSVVSFLESRGWIYKCDNPASIWLWEKNIKGVLYRGVSTDMAIQFERVRYD